MTWRETDPQGDEARKIRWDIVEYARGRVLDLGCGEKKAFPHFIGVDNLHHAKELGYKIKPDEHVDSCENLKIFASQSCDAVFSSHLLEHIVDTESALREWWRVIKPNGYLLLYIPHKDLYPNIGEYGANTDHKHDFLPEDVLRVMRKIGGWNLLENQTRNQRDEYSFFQVYQKRNDKQIHDKLPEKPEKSVAVIRYGAFGDMIQASSILPGLKEQGFHVTLLTSVEGYEVIKHDPHVDKFILHQKEQVPNEELHGYWAWLKMNYSKVVNLSESVEGAWLAIPGRSQHQWPHEVRDKYLNKNYMEFQHELAGVPLPQRGKFYPTTEEIKWAQRERDRIDGRVVMWSLSGSAFHKAWPHTDILISRILYAYPDVHVYLVGDVLCQILERVWEKNHRVHRKSGVWSIRQSMSFAETVDLIAGSETGLLNAAAMLEVPKIVTLSHSSRENLTKHWKNTISLTPELTPCYPCHMMHYGKEFCREEKETHSALCQFNITAPAMWKEVMKILGPSSLPLPEEFEPTISLHDNKALLADNVAAVFNA